MKNSEKSSSPWNRENIDTNTLIPQNKKKELYDNLSKPLRNKLDNLGAGPSLKAIRASLTNKEFYEYVGYVVDLIELDKTQ